MSELKLRHMPLLASGYSALFGKFVVLQGSIRARWPAVEQRGYVLATGGQQRMPALKLNVRRSWSGLLTFIQNSGPVRGTGALSGSSPQRICAVNVQQPDWRCCKRRTSWSECLSSARRLDLARVMGERPDDARGRNHQRPDRSSQWRPRDL